ncbi:hypothetical protein PanWU01x14_127520 [Parasponia andersonii]|uniref:Secreted protein n=1 Tax=Parasponia andersonii TaxID=3476 RepID=A0A2P5CSG2_PARAD|nr:hypothetical protein PanWU01x14_127520 [Parasponia andersonii]
MTKVGLLCFCNLLLVLKILCPKLRVREISEICAQAYLAHAYLIKSLSYLDNGTLIRMGTPVSRRLSSTAPVPKATDSKS